MSIKQVWLNLPVKDLKRSKEFYKKIGFIINPMHEKAEHLGSFLIGESKFVLMLFPENTFQGFISHSIADTNIGSEMLINIDAETREEVDKMAEKVRLAGGTIYAEPGESGGWMYAFGFIDLDGHRWSMLYMDMTKMPT
jgi:predicted lactoylglutathione lyase